MDIASILIYIVLTLAGALYLYLKKKYSYFEEKGIPHTKPSSWLFGNLAGVGSTVHMMDMIQEVYDESKRKGDVIGGFYTLASPTLVVTDLELIKQITVKDFHNFQDREVFVNEENEPLTANLFSIGGEKWRFLRNKLSPVFTSGKIKSMFNTISDKGDNFVKAVERASKSGSVEVKGISNRYTLDVISSCAFGMEANTLNDEHPELVNIFKKVFSAEGLTVIRFFFLFAFPRLSKYLKIRQFEKVVTEYFNDVIGGSIIHREKTNEKRNDFLEMLIQLKNKGSIEGEFSTESRKLTMDECIAQGFIFFFGGADTSSTVISWAIIELSQCPEIQEKLRKEIIEKTQITNGEITYDNLQEMTYLGQVMNETLRKYPPAFVNFRQALNDYKIPGSKHIIKGGEQIMIANGAIHYDQQYWKNPQLFDPDRFNAEEIGKRPTFTFMPFGEGPRNCIGMRFAQVSVKYAIATLVKEFKIKIDASKTQLPLKLHPKEPVLSPVGGFWVTFEKI